MNKLTQQAFDNIQSNLALWNSWNNAQTEEERLNLLVEEAYQIGYREGYDQCNEDISMGSV